MSAPGGSTGPLAWVIAWSAANPWTVLLASAVIAVLGALAASKAPLDAIPDLSDTQVIVEADWMGRSPDLVEDQVTTPLTGALLGSPGVMTVRGQSGFGMSQVYVLFVDGTSPEEARTRVAEAVARVRDRLPTGVTPRLGPDASAVGWVFQYALVDEQGVSDAATLRTLQETTLRPALQALDGVAEVATVGGFQRTVEVSLDPARLRAHGVSYAQVAEAISSANVLAGGGTIEIAGHEQMLRTRSEARSFDDLLDAPIFVSAGSAAVAAQSGSAPSGALAGDGMAAMGGMGGPGSGAAPASSGGTAAKAVHLIRVRDVADVQWAPAPRRGVADFGGKGDAVGGIVIARQGVNALAVISRVEEQLDSLRAALPGGVELVTVYDRSVLIREAVSTLLHTLGEEMLVVSLVILLFLRHLKSTLVPVLALPVAVLAAFIPLFGQGLTVNIMSLGGIAVAVGAMVDASILVVENVHTRLASWEAAGKPGSRHAVLVTAMQEVAPAAFFALLVVTVSFVPVFALEAAEGRLFSPLAWTKTWSMFFAAMLAVTLTPALIVLTRGGGRAERDAHGDAAGAAGAHEGKVEHHEHKEDWLAHALAVVYAPIVRRVVRYRWLVVALAIGVVGATIPALLSLPAEFMPPLNEGSLLYMPSAPPGISEAEAGRALIAMDKAIAEVPEVLTVFGKMGRADTATDPAPLGMAETVIQLRPREEWRPGFTWDDIVADLDAHLKVPGLPNAWWMPVQTRTEMLATGLRSPLGLKVYGPTLAQIETAAVAIEATLAKVPGTRSAIADRATGAFTLDLDVRRADAAALGVRPADIAATLEGALGGRKVGDWYAGRARFPLFVRYARDFRSDPEAIAAAWVDRPGGEPVALSTVADLRFGTGPDMIRSEDGQLVGFVFIDPGDVPVTSWVEAAEPMLDGVELGEGVRVEWAGTFQSLARANARLAWMVPITLAFIALLLRLNTGSWAETGIVLLAVPFSLVGAVWLLWALDYHTSVATWVGMIALAGLDAETGVVMLLYLSMAWKHHGGAKTAADLEDVVVEGAARRLRPKLMTVATAMLGLIPVFWSVGAGADVMRRIAAPMVGGLVSSFILELLVYPAVFAIWKWGGMKRLGAMGEAG
ncbi:hypothetical protein LBMAG42_50920 [Deltaproteobacteria bacterium]|nr:hypothetical protein LBMAG42_50920 [Deltaproteobacteria bacterium]